MATQIRGDVQGMRAVAVLVVIAAHAGVPFLPGGFVGVDVFYVVSGYLIAALLYREIQTDGSFSLTRFWSRRARRILPAATLVTVVTVGVSLFWLSLIDARQVVIDSIWATLFAANVHFAWEGTDYFSADVGPSPLQHYWSLGVEEQFYVAWPLLLLGALASARLVQRRRKNPPRRVLERRLARRPVLIMLVVLTVASFAWSVHQTAASPTTAYFSTFTRGWELSLGAMAALVPPRFVRYRGRWTITLASLIGLGAIAAACVLYSSTTAFPGYAAALPVVGTAVLLIAGSGGYHSVPARALSWRPMRIIGDWSYSLYLWHWPALILTERLLGRALEPWERVVAVAAVFVLAGLSYRLIEMPFRTGWPARRLRLRRGLLLYPISLSLVAASAWGAWYYTGAQVGGDNPPITAAYGRDSVKALVRASVSAAQNSQQIPSNLSPDLLKIRDSVADVGACDYEQNVTTLCARGDVNADRTVVLIGDSHARAWIPAFDKITVAGGWKAYYFVKPQCTAAHVTVASLDDPDPFTDCDAFHDWVIDNVDALDPALVVVASSPPVNGVFDGDRRVTALDRVSPILRAGYTDLFKDLEAAADRVVLLRDVPKSSQDPATCLTGGSASLGLCMFEPVERSRLLGDIGVAAARGEGVQVVDPTPWLCWEGECPVVIGGILSYRDTDHITVEYAASLSDALGKALKMLPHGGDGMDPDGSDGTDGSDGSDAPPTLDTDDLGPVGHSTVTPGEQFGLDLG